MSYALDAPPMYDDEPDWPSPEQEAEAEWLDAHEFDDFGFESFRIDIDAAIEGHRQGWVQWMEMAATLKVEDDPAHV
jgi:hypothetical protein